MTTQKHQHPYWVIGVFLAIALGALVLILANNTAPADIGSGGTPGPDATAFECTRGVPEGFALSDVEGHSLSDVETWAAGKGWTVRVVAEDGQPLAATADYSPDRVNTQVEAGVVTRYCGNG
jgi:hypothetical protein